MFVFLFSLFLLVFPVFADELNGKVVGVKDGDTITVLVGERDMVTIRLEGIDSPEKNQDFGNQAKQFTSKSAIGKQVRVEITGKDKYDRKLGTVILPDGSNLNLQIVSNGFAWHYQKYNRDPAISAAQAQAQSVKAGLWSHPSPVPPWDFRKDRDTLESTLPVVRKPTPVPSEVMVGTMSNRDLLKLPLSVNIPDPNPQPRPSRSIPSLPPTPARAYNYSQLGGYTPRTSRGYGGYGPSPSFQGYSAPPPHRNTQWSQVDGYFKKNGTYVSPHMRRTH